MQEETPLEAPIYHSLLQAAFDNQLTATMFGRANGEIIAVNKAACQMFGYTSLELKSIGRQGITLQNARNNEVLSERLQKGEMNLVMDFKRKSGEIFKGRVYSKIIKDDAGQEFSEISVLDISHEEKIAEKVNSQNEMIGNLMANSSDIIGVINSAGERLMINDAAYAIFGYSGEEMVDRQLIDVVIVDDREKTMATIADLPQTRIAIDFRNRIMRADGTLAFLSWNYKYDEKSELIYCTGRDITAITKLENELHKKQTYLTAYDDFTADALFVHDFSGRLIEVNIQACKSLGYTRAELLQLNVTDIENDFDIHSAQTAWRNIIPQQPNMLEGHQRRKDGTSFPVEIQFGCFDTSGQRFYMAFVRDVTQRKDSEEALKKSESLFRSLIANLTVGVLKQGTDGGVMISNNAALKMLGLTNEQLIGKTCFDPAWNIIHADQTPFPGEQHPVPVAIQTKKPVKNVIMGVYRPTTNERVWLLVNAEPAFNEIGEIDHVICTIQDITDEFLLTQSLSKSRDELKILTEDLKIKTEQLSKSNADLEQFAYAASHDLQEPLRMVTSFLTKLDEKYGELIDEKGKRYLYFAVDGALRMKQLVNDILAFSKVGSAAEALQPVDIQQIIDEIKIMQRSEIGLSNAQLICCPLPVVNTLKTPVKQVFGNLVSNALKYRRTDAAPRIEISYAETPSHYQFSITDNGIGVSPDYFEKIFIIFKRLHTKDEYEGTGIGLAIVKKNVELLGGRIWVESALGTGSTFHFTIAKSSTPVAKNIADDYPRKIEF